MSTTRPQAAHVIGFNPVPMANQVATLGSRLRSRVMWTLLSAAIWTGIWWTQRDRWGNPWLLVAGYGISLALILITLVRLLIARRHLARIGSGPALEADRQGIRLHSLDGRSTDVWWQDVKAIRTTGLKLGVGPEMVVETNQAVVWAAPLSFLDALPGTIDGALRACSGGAHGLDLTALDRLW